jgi:hypothetical protein
LPRLAAGLFRGEAVRGDTRSLSSSVLLVMLNTFAEEEVDPL